MLGGIQAEDIHSHFLQPEADDFLRFSQHLGILLVQVGAVDGKGAVIIDAVEREPNLLSPGPGVTGVGIRPNIPVVIGRIGTLSLDEPGMLVRSLPQADVEDRPDPARVGGFQQVAQVCQRAVLGVDILVIRHIIAMVRGRRIDQHQPDTRNTQVDSGVWVAIVEIVQFLDDAFQVADPITVAVVERAYVDLVKHRVVPPRIDIRALGHPGKGGNSHCGRFRDLLSLNRCRYFRQKLVMRHLETVRVCAIPGDFSPADGSYRLPSITHGFHEFHLGGADIPSLDPEPDRSGIFPIFENKFNDYFRALARLDARDGFTEDQLDVLHISRGCFRR